MTEDWRQNPSVIAIVEFVLRSIIRAHPGAEDEGKRLRTAMKVLFDIAPPKGKPVEPDLEELLFMASEYAAARGKFETRDDYVPFWPNADDRCFASPTQLAERAIKARQEGDPEYRLHNKDERERTLVRKFEEQRDGLLSLVVGHGREGEASVLRHAVSDMREILNILGIPVENIAQPNRIFNDPY